MPLAYLARMARRDKPLPHRTPPPAGNRLRHAFLRALVTLVALAVTILAAAGVQGMWNRLPRARAERFEERSDSVVQKTFRVAREVAPANVQHALACQYVAERYLDAWRDPNRLAAAHTGVEWVSQASVNDLGRLQAVSLRLLELDRAGKPPATQWDRIATDLQPLATGDFAHHITDLIKVYAKAYDNLGLSSLMAYQASVSVANAHGPWLEDTVQRLQTLAAHEPAAADVCHRIVRRLLRQWTLDPAPVGLRLIAADRLARELATSPDETERELGTQLAEWRTAVRDARIACPPPSPLLAPMRDENVAPAQHATVMNTLLCLLTALGTAIGAGVITLLLLVLRMIVRSDATAQAGRWPYRAGFIVTALLFVGALQWPTFWPARAAVEQLRLGHISEVGRPWFPAFAGLLAIVLILLGGLLRRPQGVTVPYVHRAATVGLIAWLWMSVVAFVGGDSLLVQLKSYDAAGYDRVVAELTAPDPPVADILLMPLRTWQP